MTDFVRVRDENTKAEYDVPTQYHNAFPDGLEVIDPEPVQQPRPVKHPENEEPTEEPGGKPAPSEPKTPKSVGNNEKAGN